MEQEAPYRKLTIYTSLDNKNIMKTSISKIILTLFATASVLYVHGQQDAQYTQYMYNTTVINPAYAGNRGVTSINTILRSQWVGLEGAPQTLQGSINAPVGNNVGLGFSFVNDEIGPSRETIVNADFSYTIDLSYHTKLSFGIKGGFSLLDVDFSQLTFTPDSSVQNIQDEISPTVGAGLYIHHSDVWFFGLSAPNLLKTQHYREGVQNSEITEEVHTYLIGGYVFDLNEDTKLKPTFLAKAVTGAPVALDFSVNMLFQDTFTLGAAYRVDAAVSALAAFQVSPQIMIGYSYDYDTTPLGNYNAGSHEIFLRYEFINLKKGIRSPRFF